MESTFVKDLMVPIKEYAVVQSGASLLDALFALEKAQESFTTNKYEHRAVLVLDGQGKVLGKIGQMRILKAIETRPDLELEVGMLERLKFSQGYITNLKEKQRVRGPILTDERLKEAALKKVDDFMQRPTAGEFVSDSCALDVAIHRLVAGTHLSLLVTKDEEIVGILRISDVFAAVFHKMKDISINGKN